MKFAIVAPADVQLQRSGKQLKHRNGMVEAAVVEFQGKQATYRISAE